jgi:hypothetical protein
MVVFEIKFNIFLFFRRAAQNDFLYIDEIGEFYANAFEQILSIIIIYIQKVATKSF